MNYYCIRYRQYREDAQLYMPINAYYYLPTAFTVTTDKEEALKWFDAIINQIRRRPFNEVLEVRERELNYMCVIKEAVFKCVEPGFAPGLYQVELNCYNYNPLEK